MSEILVQETLFSFLGEEKAVPVQEKKKKSKATITKPTKPVNKPLVDEKLEVKLDTMIRYGGETFPITEYFTESEIIEGIRITEGEKQGEFRPITSEDLRKRMEEEFPELIEGYSTMVYNEEKNLVIPILQARKKG